MKRNEIGLALRHLSLIYPKAISEEIIDIYFDVLGGFSSERFGKGMDHIKNNWGKSFFPSPAEMKQIIGSIPGEQQYIARPEP